MLLFSYKRLYEAVSACSANFKTDTHIHIRDTKSVSASDIKKEPAVHLRNTQHCLWGSEKLQERNADLT